jgi:hypothetical protein
MKELIILNSIMLSNLPISNDKISDMLKYLIATFSFSGNFRHLVVEKSIK